MGEAVKVYTLDEIREKMYDRNIVRVSEVTGIPKDTLYSIIYKRVQTIKLDTYTKLVEYLYN